MLVDLPPQHPVSVMTQDVHRYVQTVFPHARYGIKVKVYNGDYGSLGSPYGPIQIMGLAYKEQRTVAYTTPALPALYNAAVRVKLGKKLNMRQRGMYRVALHEVIHLVNSEGYRDPGLRQADEAATEAVTLDLYPEMMRKITGSANPITGYEPTYLECVKSLRYVSAKATGTKWKKMPARAWRYQFMLANGETKKRMLRDQGVALGALCRIFP